MGEALRSQFLAVFGYHFVIGPVIVLDKVFDGEICLKISEAYLMQTVVPLLGWVCLACWLDYKNKLERHAMRTFAIDKDCCL